VGINLNPNNACNYRCIYCQVPNLVFGKAPAIDLVLLERELDAMLQDVLHGDFLEQNLPPDCRRLNDVALSGNGEPTSSSEFPEVIDLVGRVLEGHALVGSLALVLITNGTLVDRAPVQRGISRMSELGGQVWFKLDSATREGTARVNDNGSSMDARIERLKSVAPLCPTWLQTCVFALDAEPPSAQEQGAYLDLIARLVAEQVPLAGVLLYGLARPSLQPEAPRLSRLPEAWLEEFAERIRERGLAVKVTP
jgi:wyosine [tRNA(Phe)-imidazoG37] synthetase (radical SAM superfamily)